MINIFVILFLIGVTYWFALQGFFSSFLHLLFVIVAGLLAFGLWEVVAHLMLGQGGSISQFAFSAGLILPFAIILIILRFAGDKFVGGNIHFSPLIDGIGGGILGLVSAVLTVGLFLHAVNYTPLAKQFMGYAPLVAVTAGDEVVYEKGKGVFMSPEAKSVGFFQHIASGPFRPMLSETSLDDAYPDLPRLSQLWRAAADENSLRAAQSDTVTIDGVRVVSSQELAGAVSPEVREALGGGGADDQIVIVETTWNKADKGGVYDSGSTLRLSPGQVLLFAETGGETSQHLPIGYARGGGYEAFAEANQVAAGRLGGDGFQFFYRVPKNRVPAYLYARGLRFPIDAEPDESVASAARLIGSVGAREGGTVAPVERTVPRLWEGQTISIRPQGSDPNAPRQAFEVMRTASLPKSVNVNAAGAADTRDHRDGALLPGGDATFTGASSGGQRTTIRELMVEEPFTMLRVQVEPRAVRTDLGSRGANIGQDATNLVNNLFPEPMMKTDAGNTIDCVAWAALPTNGGDLRVVYESSTGVAGRTLGNELSQLGDDMDLYLYFRVLPGSRITDFSLARNLQKVDFYVPRGDESEDDDAADDSGGNNRDAGGRGRAGNSRNGVPDPVENAPGARIGL